MLLNFQQLRAKRIAEATREFRARGKSVVRCATCQLADYACVCRFRPQLQSRSEFVLLLHRNEVFKPTNTGRLIAEVLPQQTHVSCWHRTEPEAGLLQLLAADERQCCIVFPDENGPQLATTDLETTRKINSFILLDGTWKQARRMITLSRWLDEVPRLKLPDTLLRGYAVRKSAHAHQLATAEAAALCLELAGEQQQSHTLLDYFTVFNRHYEATRGCYAPEVGDVHTRLLEQNNL